jgi:hypothetical protein
MVAADRRCFEMNALDTLSSVSGVLVYQVIPAIRATKPAAKPWARGYDDVPRH